MTELITKVGRYEVRDGGALLPKRPDGTVELTLAEGSATSDARRTWFFSKRTK